jgi:uncharacterized protein (TIGR03435 family)
MWATTSRRRPALLVVLLFSVASAGLCQGISNPAAPTAAKPIAYDVVSVKQDRSGSDNISFHSSRAGIRITNAPLIDLLRDAFGLDHSTDDQITGLPAWAKSERFDIDAKVAEEDIPAIHDATNAQRQEMLRTILGDRFRLVAHRETRQKPVYALIVGKHGSKLIASNPEVPGTGHVNGCREGCMSTNNTHTEAKGITIETLTAFLTRQTDRTVIDKTGLTGKFDLTLDWTPPEQSGSATATAPELFTALEEQLGLRLESQKGSVEGLVVDHIEEPSAN